MSPGIIEKRDPLGASARRAGWVGGNILLKNIPEVAKIKIIENGKILDKDEVMREFRLAGE